MSNAGALAKGNKAAWQHITLREIIFPSGFTNSKASNIIILQQPLQKEMEGYAMFPEVLSDFPLVGPDEIIAKESEITPKRPTEESNN